MTILIDLFIAGYAKQYLGEQLLAHPFRTTGVGAPFTKTAESITEKRGSMLTAPL